MTAIVYDYAAINAVVERRKPAAPASRSILDLTANCRCTVVDLDRTDLERESGAKWLPVGDPTPRGRIFEPAKGSTISINARPGNIDLHDAYKRSAEACVRLKARFTSERPREVGGI